MSSSTDRVLASVANIDSHGNRPPEPRTLNPEPSPGDALPILWGLPALQAAVRSETAWLWHGYLAPGCVTLLTSQWKSGKTTLVSILLTKLHSGGELAGQPVVPARAVVVSEEDPAHWLRRARLLKLADHVGFLCRPFPGKPRMEHWLALLDHVAGLREKPGLDLVVIDTLAAFLPGRDENTAGSMIEALSPLSRLTARGISVLLAHHPRKGETAAGQAARGSGALAAFVDISIEMTWHQPADTADRRRRLLAFSRHPETPRQLVIELNAAGTDYTALGSFEDEEFASTWQDLRAILEPAFNKLTRTEIVSRWPAGRVPDKATVRRWLDRAVAKGLLCRDGLGRKADPFRYWLPGQTEKWRKDPLAFLNLPGLPQR
jgi:hypothetical protein